MIRFGTFLLILAFGVSVYAIPTQDDLRQIELKIKQEQQAVENSGRKAAELSDEVKNVQNQMVRLARSVQEKEDVLTELEQKQAETLIREKELEKKLQLTNRQMVQLMSGLQTLALRPKELVLMRPTTPLETFRSWDIIGYALPVVKGTNRQTRSDIAELSQVRADLQEQIVRIKSTRLQLSEQSNQMDRLLQQKSILQAQYQVSQEQSQKRVKVLGEQARDLKELLERIEREQQEKERAKAQVRMAQGLSPHSDIFAGAKGRLPYPIHGVVTERFGTELVGGGHAKGIRLVGRSKAQVISPFDGTVLFSGPFKSYGDLVIIDHGDNYLSLLAGMDQIFTTTGQEVLAGEPIGYVKSDKPELYIEIRKDGQALDPLPWFVANR